MMLPWRLSGSGARCLPDAVRELASPRQDAKMARSWCAPLGRGALRRGTEAGYLLFADLLAEQLLTGGAPGFRTPEG